VRRSCVVAVSGSGLWVECFWFPTHRDKAAMNGARGEVGEAVRWLRVVTVLGAELWLERLGHLAPDDKSFPRSVKSCPFKTTLHQLGL
jgi:hypothetical protein